MCKRRKNKRKSSLLHLPPQQLVSRKMTQVLFPRYTGQMFNAQGNRRHQTAIITDPGSSRVTRPILGLFGLLQFVGIVFNVGLGKTTFFHCISKTTFLCILEVFYCSNTNETYSYLQHTGY